MINSFGFLQSEGRWIRGDEENLIFYFVFAIAFVICGILIGWIQWGRCKNRHQL